MVSKAFQPSPTRRRVRMARTARERLCAMHCEIQRQHCWQFCRQQTLLIDLRQLYSLGHLHPIADILQQFRSFAIEAISFGCPVASSSSRFSRCFPSRMKIFHNSPKLLVLRSLNHSALVNERHTAPLTDHERAAFHPTDVIRSRCAASTLPGHVLREPLHKDRRPPRHIRAVGHRVRPVFL